LGGVGLPHVPVGRVLGGVYVCFLCSGLLFLCGLWYMEVFEVEVFPPVVVLRSRDGRFAVEVDGYRVFGRSDFAWHPLAGYISRRHFAVKRVDGPYYIVDLGSTNGTFVNGVDIRGRGLYPLRRGDVVNVAGVVELVVE